MSRISLSDFAAKHGQHRAAELLGVTQGALNKALRVGRNIYVEERLDGSCAAEEVRQFPSRKTTY